jgi:hypothetical protein
MVCTGGNRVYSPSRKIREQVARLDGKRLRQLDDILKRHISLAALNSADVIPMQSGALGQFLLGIAARGLSSQIPAEPIL